MGKREDWDRLKPIDWAAINAALEREREAGTHAREQAALRRLNKIWHGMKQRCENPNADAFERYGARGIEVCEEWQDFDTFYRWALDNGYAPELTIERDENTDGYSPGNCRWATMREQGRNKTNNVLVTIRGETKYVAEWAEVSGLAAQTVRARVRPGWTGERILAKLCPSGKAPKNV